MKKIGIILAFLIYGITGLNKAYADTFYWIGGSGNWSEIAHWGKYSGAPFNGGQSYGRVPNWNDVVIFDDNSGFTATNRTVTLNQEGFCKDLRFEGTAVVPIFTLNSNMNIAGSLLLQPGMSITSPSNTTRIFRFGHPSVAEDGNYTITTNGVVLNINVEFIGNAGSGAGTWTTVDSFKVGSSASAYTGKVSVTGGTWIAGAPVNIDYRDVAFTGGAIDWSGQSVTVAGMDSDNSNTRNLNMENATIKVLGVSGTSYGNNVWRYRGSGASLSAAGSSLILAGVRNTAIYANNADIYNKIIFEGDATSSATGTFSTSLTIDTLVLQRNANLAAGITLNVRKRLDAVGCSWVFTFSATTLATVNMGSAGVANVNVKNIHIQNIAITGSDPSYPAINCGNLGSNSGWNFVSSNNTVYWVGGAGDWSDISHWASSSGGIGGTGCIPSAGMDVVFDDNSGFDGQTNEADRTVTLGYTTGVYPSLTSHGATVGYCRNMTWRNMDNQDKPTFNMMRVLNIYGSLEWQEGMNVQYHLNYHYFASVRMFSNQPATITNNNVVWKIPDVHGTWINLEFNGQGPFTVVDNLYVDGSVALTSGTLVMKDITGRIGVFRSNTNNTTNLDIRNSTITIDKYLDNGASSGSVGDMEKSWWYVGNNSTLQAEGSNLIFAGNITTMSRPFEYNTLCVLNTHTYNKITFATNGIIQTNATIDSLIIEADCDSLFLRANITVNNYLKTVSNCKKYKTVTQYNMSAIQTITMGPNVDIDVNYTVINQISASGSAIPYNVNNSIVVSATGWKSVAGSSNTLYWVGGAGNWDDVNHWASSSGGVGGSGCLPSIGDNVVFDALSGFSVDNNKVTVPYYAACNNMTWSGMNTMEKPELVLNYPICVYGSVVWQQGMTISGGSYIDMRTESVASIQSNGVITRNLTFSGNGILNIPDKLEVAGTLNMTGNNGTLNALDDVHVTGTFYIADSLNTVNMTGINVYLGAVAATNSHNNIINMSGSNIAIPGTFFLTTSNNNQINLSNADAVIGAFSATGSNNALDIIGSVIEVNRNFTPTTNDPVVWRVDGIASLAATNSTLKLNSPNVTYNTIRSPVNHIYGNVVFMKSGNINNSLTIDSLFIGTENISNLTVQIVGGQTLTIKNYLESLDCQNIKTLKSTNTNRANIAMQTGATLNADHTLLAYLNFTGSPPYTANNCIDGGSNMGVVFGNVGKTYYWVNGAGDWSDLLHWATSSGGVGGEGCVPLVGDDVVFDENSGFASDGATVTVSSTAYCRNMTWHNMTYNFPHFEINGGILNIYGSLEWQQNMTVNIAANNLSYIRFLAPNTVNITSNGVVIKGIYNTVDIPRIEFNTASGKWKMTDDFKVEGCVLFTDGDIDMSGITVHMGGFYSHNSNTRKIDISNSTVRLTNYYYRGVNMSRIWNLTGNNSVLLSNGTSLYLASAGGTSYNILTLPSDGTIFTFQKIVVEQTCTVSGVNKIVVDTLILKENSGAALYLSSNDWTINKYFESLNCKTYNTFGNSSLITVTMGTGARVNADHLYISNVKLIGDDTPYKAKSSINTNPVNATGWDLSEGRDLYWVGSGGVWDAPQHWASTSGGTPGSGCIPSPADNVFFDDKSGFISGNNTVTIPNIAAYCKNMTWHNMDALYKPWLSVSSSTKNSSSTLNIYGSLEWQQGMTVEVGHESNPNQYINMLSNDSVTIKTNGVQITPYHYNPFYGYPRFRFSGSGAYKLLDDFAMPTQKLLFSSGRLYINDVKVTAHGFESTGSAARTLNINSGEITITTGEWKYSGSNATLVADSSRINMNTGNFYGLNTHTYDTLVYLKRGGIAHGTTLNTLILAQGFNGSDPTFYFPAGGTVTINKKIITGGTPCEMVKLLSSTAGTKANINVPASAFNIENTTPIGFDLNFAYIRDLNVVTGADKAFIRLTNQSDEFAVGTNTGNWVMVPYEGLKGVTLGRDTSMWCNATFPLNTDHFYGDHNTKYLWTDNSTDNNLIITEFGDYWVQVNYSPTCVTSDTIHVSKDDDLHLSGAASPTGGRVKVSLSRAGISVLDPSPVYVLDSVQPAGAMANLPLSQSSPDFYFDTPVRAFFSHADALSGCDDICEVVTPVVAVSDTVIAADRSVAKVAVLRNDFTYLEGCSTPVATALSTVVTAQHGAATLLDDTVRYIPDADWTGIDSLHYIIDVCGERSTAAVYFITVRDTFEACFGVSATMTLPDVTDMSYVWYNNVPAEVSTTNTYTVVKGGADDIGDWQVKAVWRGMQFAPFTVYLIDGTASTAAQIAQFTGDTLILVNTSTTVAAHATSDVVNPQFHWYKDATGATLFHTGDSYTTSSLTVDTTFYVAVSGDNYCTATERKAVTVHVIPPPQAVTDLASMYYNTVLDYDVLANDVIPGACTMPGITVVAPVTNGSADVVNGKLVYTPTTGFYGRNEVGYIVGCGSVVSNPAGTLDVLVVKPLSDNYYACPGATVTLGFEPISNVVYNWYATQTGGTSFASGNNITRTKDNSGTTETYWVEPVYNGVKHPRLKVELQSGDCGVINPTGCAVTGTILYKEDFGGNSPSDPSRKPTGIPQVIGYNYVPTGYISPVGSYAISKTSQTLSDGAWGGWYLNLDDHTYTNDYTRGYFMGFDASQNPGQFYECEINGLCAGYKLHISTWLVSLLNYSTPPDKTNMIFIIEDMQGNVLANYYTGNVPDADPNWKQYGFEFTMPAGQSSIKLKIINNGTGSNGDDFAIDDIEIRFCAPQVNLTSPTKMDTTVCEGSEFKFEGNYTDDGTFGNDLVYRWERNVTGDLNNPADWVTIAGTEGTSNDGTASSVYTIDPVTKSDSAHYRLAIANAANIDNYNCRAMSNIILLRTKYCLTSVAIGADDTVCYNTAPAELKLETNIVGTVSYQWLQSDDSVNWTAISPNGDTPNYSPPALKETTFYRLDVTHDGKTVSSNVITITILPASLFNYPDLRIRVCRDAGVVNLSRYIDSLEVTFIEWISPYSGLAILSPEGSVDVDKLPASRALAFTYRASNTCMSDTVTRKAYIEILQPDRTRLILKDTITVCHKYAEALLVNRIFGIEADGEWSFDGDGDITPYIIPSTSSTYGGAVVVNGKALYNDASITPYTYHALPTKRVTITYTPRTAPQNCLSGKSYRVTIILTENMVN